MVIPDKLYTLSNQMFCSSMLYRFQRTIYTELHLKIIIKEPGYKCTLEFLVNYSGINFPYNEKKNVEEGKVYQKEKR